MADIRCNCCGDETSIFGTHVMYQCTNPSCNAFRWIFCDDCLKRQKASKKGLVFKDWCCPYCSLQLKEKRFI
jgi:hypothetical protein